MDSNEAVVVDTQNNEVESEASDTITLSKSDYEKMNQDLGSLKRELKDIKKAKSESKPEVQETTQKTQESNGLLEKAFLRSANITDAEEVDLALSTAKKWGVSVDQLVDDPDFQVKLDRMRTQKSNERATSGVKGSSATSNVKNTPEYWQAKGNPPTPEDVPDRKTRTAIITAMMKTGSSNGKKFYND